MTSYSSARVSNDNPLTCKYRPSWPTEGFKSLEAARDWVLSLTR
ncbi:hypothetical protein [Psychrobacter faecalis]